MIPCPVLSEVIQLDGTFKWLSWSYCTTDTCTTKETKWSWMGGMNSQRMTQVTHKGRFAGGINLTQNGTLVLSKVQVSYSTDYRCTVQRINFTSPRIYFVTLIVNATGKRCRLVTKYFYYTRTEIYALKSHVINFRTEISYGQSEGRTTFFTCEKHRLSNQRPRTMLVHCSELPKLLKECSTIEKHDKRDVYFVFL